MTCKCPGVVGARGTTVHQLMPLALIPTGLVGHTIHPPGLSRQVPESIGLAVVTEKRSRESGGGGGGLRDQEAGRGREVGEEDAVG